MGSVDGLVPGRDALLHGNADIDLHGRESAHCHTMVRSRSPGMHAYSGWVVTPSMQLGTLHWSASSADIDLRGRESARWRTMDRSRSPGINASSGWVETHGWKPNVRGVLPCPLLEAPAPHHDAPPLVWAIFKGRPSA